MIAGDARENRFNARARHVVRQGLDKWKTRELSVTFPPFL